MTQSQKKDLTVIFMKVFYNVVKTWLAFSLYTSISQVEPCMRGVIDHCITSKHLKGQLRPRVPNVTSFAPKEVSWGPTSPGPTIPS